MIHKKHLLGHDYSKFSKYQLEMCLQGIIKIKPLIIPTSKYDQLPEGKDENALHLMEQGRDIKEHLFKKFYSKIMI